jgi:ABC-2 type transport system ATP-binding protein
MSVVELDRVTKRYGDVVALNEVSLRVDGGSVVALLGPNGAGKSTALAVLLGLRRAQGGSVRLLGLDPREPAARRGVGVAMQETAFPLTLRVREVIELVCSHYPAPQRASSLYARFRLEPLVHRQLGGLSSGERRRVAVALAFAGAAGFVVLDEPTAALDVDSRHAVWDAVRAQAEGGGTVLLTTHHLDEAEALADRAILIEGGSVVAEGTIAEIKRAAGGTRISFRAAPGVIVDGAERDGTRLRIVAADAGEVVARLVRLGVPLPDLEVRPLTLEEALALRTDGRVR